MNESDLIPYVPTVVISAQRVLVLAPHPDDEVFGCGGAIASHVKQGVCVKVVVLTDGSLNGSGGVRAAECRAAASVLGYGEPVFWGVGDRSLACSDVLVDRLVDLIVSEQIDLLYAPSPWEIHPDHRQASWLAVEGVRRSRGLCRVAFYEVGAPLRPNILLDITCDADLKQRAMACFSSQMLHQPYSAQITALNRYRTYTLPASVQFAEAFLLVAAHELESVANLLQMELAAWSGSSAVDAISGRQALVSVLIRSMDREYLFEALDSIAAQTWPHIEVVVVSAVPGHQTLPRRCGPHELRLVETELPLQRAAAANVALREAKGEFLIFLDDDDWFMPSHIARLVQALERQPMVMAAYTGVALVNEDGKPSGQILDLPFDFVRQRAGNLTPIHSVMFKSKILAQGAVFDEALELYEDWDFWLRLAQLTVFIHLPGISAAYRIHDSSGVHREIDLPTGGLQKVQENWRHKGFVTPEDLMRRVWSYSDMSQELMDMRAIIDGHQIKIGDLQYSQQKMSNELASEHAANQKLSEELLSSKSVIAANRVYIDEVEKVLISKDADFKNIIESRSWRLTRPLRWLVWLLRILFNQLRLPLIKKAWVIFRREGWRSALYRTQKHLIKKTPTNSHDYELVFKNECSQHPERWPDLVAQQASWSLKPLISVIMPVYNPPVDLLIEAVSSVQSQIYSNWEICIADDASTNPLVWSTLESLAAQDNRIKIIRHLQNGHISKASNSALSLAGGDFFALMDNDDIISPDAFHWVVDALNRHPEANIFYSDEDKLDSEGRHFGPYFKPDWNYTLFLGHNMISHLGVYRGSLVKSLGGFREGLEGSQDYDLALRCIENCHDHQIIHIPRLLYHWRAIEGSTALSVDAKPYALVAAQRALTEHRVRIGLPAEVEILPTLNYQLKRPSPPMGSNISLILVGASEKVEHSNWWVTLGIDDVLFCEKNVAALNQCLEKAQGKFLAIFDVDLKPLAESSLRRLVEFANEPLTGMAGGLIQDSKGSLISGGLVLNNESIASVLMKNLPYGNAGYMGRAALPQELSAITPDCMVMRKDVYQKVGGWPLEYDLGLVGAVEWALRVRLSGLRVVWEPRSVWRCSDDFSADSSDVASDIKRFKKNHPRPLLDAAYHPVFDPVAADFTFASS